MKRVISPRSTRIVHEFYRTFEWADTPGAGFSFASDEDGNVLREQLTEAALANLALCESGGTNGEAIVDRGVAVSEQRIVDPAVLACDCGRKVLLEGYASECRCGEVYNLAGQRLRKDYRLDGSSY